MMDTKFKQLADDYIDEMPALSPVTATWLGDHRYDGELDGVSVGDVERETAFCRRYLERLDEIRVDDLSRANQVDAAMLRHRLKSDIWHQETLREWAWNPIRYTDLSGNAIYGLLAREFAPLDERLMNVASRLEQFPRLTAQIREILEPERVPRVHAEQAVARNRGVKSMLDTMVRPQMRLLETGERERLEKAIRVAKAALDEQQQWLEETLLPQATAEFRLGAERFDQKLAFTLQTDMDRPAIRAAAVAEMRRTREKMWEISAGIYRQEHPCVKMPEVPSEEYRQAIIRAALEIACRDLPDPNRMVQTASEMVDELTEFVREKELVTVAPDPVELIEMPEFRRGIALAYCDSPGPLDVGQKTFYAIAPPPAGWNEKQVHSLLREYNMRSLKNLSVHEAMPGHYLQLTHSNRYPSTLRAILCSGVFIEGWAVYAERLMVEAGAYDDDPLAHLVVLKWRLRGIANALIDQAVHVDGMSEDEAMALMMEDTFQERSEAAGKWIRAQLTATQLSTYFVGYLEHIALRQKLEQEWGDEFTLKRYHDTILSFGSPPTRYVRALILGEPVEM